MNPISKALFPQYFARIKIRPINNFLKKLAIKQLESLKSLEIKLENLQGWMETVPKLKKLVLSLNKIQ